MSDYDERQETYERVIEFIQEIMGVELDPWQASWIHGAIIYGFGEEEEQE